MDRNFDEISDDEIIEAAKSIENVGLLALHFKVPAITMRHRIHRLGISVKNGGQNKGKIGQAKFALSDILEGKHPQYSALKLKIRILKDGILPNCCDKCKNHEWLGNQIPLELDHINGVSWDHRLENLRLLCPNCHALTDTYRGKNSRKVKRNMPL